MKARALILALVLVAIAVSIANAGTVVPEYKIFMPKMYFFDGDCDRRPCMIAPENESITGTMPVFEFDNGGDPTIGGKAWLYISRSGLMNNYFTIKVSPFGHQAAQWPTPLLDDQRYYWQIMRCWYGDDGNLAPCVFSEIWSFEVIQ